MIQLIGCASVKLMMLHRFSICLFSRLILIGGQPPVCALNPPSKLVHVCKSNLSNNSRDQNSFGKNKKRKREKERIFASFYDLNLIDPRLIYFPKRKQKNKKKKSSLNRLPVACTCTELICSFIGAQEKEGNICAYLCTG